MRIIPGFYSDQSERSLALDLTQAWPGSGHVMMRHGCCEWEAESSEGQGRGRSKQFVIVAIVKVFVIAVG